jgi:peptidoglycan hydrolase CwlO-like protein
MDSHLIITVISILVSTIGTSLIAVNFMLARMDKLDAKIDKIDTKLSDKIDQVDAKLSARMDSLDAKLSTRMDKLEDKFEDLKDTVSAIQVNIARIEVYVHHPFPAFNSNKNEQLNS